MISYPLFRPLAWLYGRIMRIRNRRFETGKTPVERVSVPVISVGNICVGGTGKTPMTIYLLRMLAAHGMHPAMLSRGYGRQTRGFMHVDAQSTASQVGDEPLEVYRTFGGAMPVFVCEDRVHGAKRLLQSHPATEDAKIDILVLDDAYQHRFIHRDINILLTDYSRLYSRDKMLPEGRLRELPEGADRADIIIVTKCPDSLPHEDAKAIRQELRPQPRQHLFFSAIAYETIDDPDLADKDMLIFTGIANPQPLINHYAPRCRSFHTLRFSDHHKFNATDIRRICSAADKAQIVITTAKDFSRLPHPLPASLQGKLHVQHIGTRILFDQEEDLKKLILNSIPQY